MSGRQSSSGQHVCCPLLAFAMATTRSLHEEWAQLPIICRHITEAISSYYLWKEMRHANEGAVAGADIYVAASDTGLMARHDVPIVRNNFFHFVNPTARATMVAAERQGALC